MLLGSFPQQSVSRVVVVQSRHWPSLIWHLYDYYLRPGGEYFGAKKACEPLHPLYSYDDRSVWVVNSSYQDVPKLRLTTRVYNLDFTEKYSEQTILDAAADSSRNIFTLPDRAKTFGASPGGARTTSIPR